jgi:hypothetical protein
MAINPNIFTSNSLVGSTIVTNGYANILIGTRPLLLTGDQLFVIRLRRNSTEGDILLTTPTITLKDNSNVISVVPRANIVNEGSSIIFDISTSNFPNGATLYYSTVSVLGTVQDLDFVNGNTGSFVINENAGVVTLTLSSDLSIKEGDEVFRLQIRNSSVTGNIIITSSNVTIFDTSAIDNNYGWFSGGAYSPTARVDRITFADDTATASVRGPLSSARSYLAATGNKDFGWFGGGTLPGVTSRVDRITFADDTGTASVRGPLSVARNQFAATGNDNFGWYSGLADAKVDRITFATDTATATARGPLSSDRFRLDATGNQNFGWWGGGQVNTPGFPHSSRVDRIDFAADTATASVRGPFSSARSHSNATSNDDIGWFSGGSAGAGPLSTVDRITFVTDTATASVRGPLSAPTERCAAASNNNFGWWGGGFSPFPTRVSRVDRITFAADTATASVRGPLSLARDNLAAAAGMI